MSISREATPISKDKVGYLSKIALIKLRLNHCTIVCHGRPRALDKLLSKVRTFPKSQAITVVKGASSIPGSLCQLFEVT